jgi:hypothetical protein
MTNNTNNDSSNGSNSSNRDKRERYAKRVKNARRSVASLNSAYALFVHVIEADDFHVVRFIRPSTGVIYHRVAADAPDLFERAARFARSMKEPHERGRPHYQTATATAHGECVTMAHVSAVCSAIGVRC